MSDASALIPLAPTAVALVTLLLNRLDRHKDAAKKELNIPDALITLAGLVRVWAEQASMTNVAAHRWIQEEMPRRKLIGRRPLSLRDLYFAIHGQKATLNAMFGMLSDSPEYHNLLRVLELYTPELTDQLVKAAKQRDAQLTELELGFEMRQAIRQRASGDQDVEYEQPDAGPLTELEQELRVRQARGDQDLESFFDELDATVDGLKEASQQLDAYVRANVPIADGN
jgi:hypothetical protein